jgi:hypothetical protein
LVLGVDREHVANETAFVWMGHSEVGGKLEVIGPDKRARLRESHLAAQSPHPKQTHHPQNESITSQATRSTSGEASCGNP